MGNLTITRHRNERICIKKGTFEAGAQNDPMIVAKVVFPEISGNIREEFLSRRGLLRLRFRKGEVEIRSDSSKRIVIRESRQLPDEKAPPKPYSLDIPFSPHSSSRLRGRWHFKNEIVDFEVHVENRKGRQGNTASVSLNFPRGVSILRDELLPPRFEEGEKKSTEK